MQSVSEEYKQAMKLQLRNRSSLFVSVGEVNPKAQTSATENERYSSKAFFSTTNSVFNGTSHNDYSTLEQDFTKVDGTMLFTPRSNSGIPYLETGFVGRIPMPTEDNDQSTNLLIILDNIDAPTADNPFIFVAEFQEDSVPVSCYVGLQWDNASWYGWRGQPVSNGKLRFRTIDVYGEKITGLWIMFGAETANYRRARIKKITFGDGVVISSDIIENVEQREYTSKINENLPTNDLQLSLINFENRYDADNPDNPLSIFDENKQPINVYYGYDVDGEENYEFVHGGSFISDSWSSGKHKATVLAKDRLQKNEDLFLHNYSDLYENPNAEYWLLQMINAMGLPPSECEYDSDMANIAMPDGFCRTIPAKEALQQLANYCCKTLYITAEGKIKVSSDEPDTGFVMGSDDIINDIVIEKEELIKEVVVPYYKYSYVPTTEVELVNEIVTIDENNYLYTQDFGGTIHGFVSVDVIEYPYIGTQSNLSQLSGYPNRLHSTNLPVVYGKMYFMHIDEDKQFTSFTEKNANGGVVRSVNVGNHEFVYEPYNNTVTQVELFVGKKDNTNITGSEVEECYFGRAEVIGGYPNDPLDYLWFLIPNSGTYKVRITSSGYFEFTGTNVRYQINDTGKSLLWDNPLIGDPDRAMQVARFVGDYLKSNLSYNYEYRGNPEIDANDVITQENDFIDDMKVVVTEHKIIFDGALKGEITARRRISE